MANSSKKDSSTAFETRFIHPKYWGIWLGVGLLWLIHQLPLAVKLQIGKLLGKLLYLIGAKRRRLAAYNIDFCFPEMTDQEKKSLLKAHFENLGLSIIETAIVWWGDHRKHPANPKERSMVTFKGLDNLQTALASGKGVLILAPHFTHLEIAGMFISFLMKYNPVYRPHNNPLMDYLIRKGRSMPHYNRQSHQVESTVPIANSNTRKMLKVLKQGEHMILLPDQRYRAKGHVVVPFFGHDAKSNPATSKIAKLTDCIVVPTFTRRKQGFNYELNFLPALTNFPSGDSYADTLRLHQLYEAEINENPAQYLWVHNRWDIKKY